VSFRCATLEANSHGRNRPRLLRAASLRAGVLQALYRACQLWPKKFISKLQHLLKEKLIAFCASRGRHCEGRVVSPLGGKEFSGLPSLNYETALRRRLYLALFCSYTQRPWRAKEVMLPRVANLRFLVPQIKIPTIA
jgi:hypothetical protein